MMSAHALDAVSRVFYAPVASAGTAGAEVGVTAVGGLQTRASASLSRDGQTLGYAFSSNKTNGENLWFTRSAPSGSQPTAAMALTKKAGEYLRPRVFPLGDDWLIASPARYSTPSPRAGFVATVREGATLRTKGLRALTSFGSETTIAGDVGANGQRIAVAFNDGKPIPTVSTLRFRSVDTAFGRGVGPIPLAGPSSLLFGVDPRLVVVGNYAYVAWSPPGGLLRVHQVDVRNGRVVRFFEYPAGAYHPSIGTIGANLIVTWSMTAVVNNKSMTKVQALRLSPRLAPLEAVIDVALEDTSIQFEPSVAGNATSALFGWNRMENVQSPQAGQLRGYTNHGRSAVISCP